MRRHETRQVTTYRIDRISVEMAETANTLRLTANAADGYHARQNGGTYGAASEAQVLALACGIAEWSRVHFDEARTAARLIVDQCVDNGENVTYQIEEVFTFSSGHVDPDGPINFTIVMVEDDLAADEVMKSLAHTEETTYARLRGEVERITGRHDVKRADRITAMVTGRMGWY